MTKKRKGAMINEVMARDLVGYYADIYAKGSSTIIEIRHIAPSFPKIDVERLMKLASKS